VVAGGGGGEGGFKPSPPCNENKFYTTSPVPPPKELNPTRIEIKNRKQMMRQRHFSVRKHKDNKELKMMSFPV